MFVVFLTLSTKGMGILLYGVILVEVNDTLVFQQNHIGISTREDNSCCSSVTANVDYKQEDDKK